MPSVHPFLLFAFALGLQNLAIAQDPPARAFLRPDPEQAPGGHPGGPGGFGMPAREEVKLVDRFDADGDGVLNTTERRAALKSLQEERGAGRLGRGPGRPGGGPLREGERPPAGQGREGEPHERRNSETPAEAGRALSSSDVQSYPGASLYDVHTLRTLFFQFEDVDWEKQLAAFHDTDVEVPAQLSVDGRHYPGVGVSMRGMSSFMMIGEGRKRSLAVNLTLTDPKQKLGGFRSLHLLNSNEDPSFLRGVVFNQIAREYLPAPQANLVRVVINGECWGIYVNQESFTKEFTAEWFGSRQGVRWKAPGHPGARGGLEYIGDDVADYRKHFELKSKEDPKAWEHLINLCRILNQTPPEQLEEQLAPILDLDEALRFLALDNVFINEDGYWTRSSDYSLYEDEAGCFHLIFHDTNETFSLPGGGPPPSGPHFSGRPSDEENNRPRSEGFPGFGPGGPGNARVKGVELDPLMAAHDERKPLLSKLLAVPSLRSRYLAYVHDMTDKWLDWRRLGPLVAEYRGLIEKDVALDTRKLATLEAFQKATADEPANPHPVTATETPREREISLRDFAERRRKYLLSYSPERAPESDSTEALARTQP